MEKNKTASFSGIIGIIGTILIGVGIAWIIAQNWHAMNSMIKILILLIATFGALSAGFLLREKNYSGTGKSLLILGALLYTLSVFLIAQIYSTDTSIQGFAWLIMASFAGVLFLAYVLEVPSILLIGIIELLIWSIVQYFALTQRTNSESFGMLAIWFLGIGLLLYGLSLMHRFAQHAFSRTYKFFTVVYFLLFAFILSFQLSIEQLWKAIAWNNMQVIIALAFFLLAIIAITIGLKKGLPDKLEIWGMMIICALLISIILLAVIPEYAGTGSSSNSGPQGYCNYVNCYDYKTKADCINHEIAECRWIINNNVLTQETCTSSGCTTNTVQSTNYSDCESKNPMSQQVACPDYNNKNDCEKNNVCIWSAQNNYNYKNYSNELFSARWFVWIWSNIVLLAIILGIIAYGIWQHDARLINISMIFFGLMIISRYIGFIMDFGNYTSMSILFIAGGIILIGGGFLLEKWRRKLLIDAEPNIKLHSKTRTNPKLKR